MEAIYSVLGSILPLEAYQYNFMKNAFLAILLLTPLLGLLGTMAVNHQMAFFSDALGHSALTGIGLGIILGLRNDLVAMLVFGIIWAILICVIKQSGSASADTVISVFSSTSVAAGLLILARGGKFAKYSALLIGDILAVTPGDLLWLLLALVATLALWALLYNSLLLTSVDSFLARSRGIRTRLVEIAFVVMVAVGSCCPSAGSACC
jgi:zinc transport system permease protein